MNPVKWLASSGLLVLILCCFRLPTSLAGGSEEEQNAAQQYKPKSVLVDVKDNTAVYNIPYDVGARWNAACEAKDECDNPQGLGKITEVLLYLGDGGHVQQLPHDDQTFNVTLQGESFTETGVEYWTVSYKYETDGEVIPPYIEHCTCQVNLSLIIVVNDLELIDNLKGDKATTLNLGGPERKLQAKQIAIDDDKSVVLNCSSGLQDQLTSLRFKFVFSTTLQDRLSINEEYNRTVWCNETNDGTTTPYPNWEVTRLDNTSCLLRLTEFSQMDNGTYGCILYHPDSNSHYNDDLSNTIPLILASDTSVIVNIIVAITIVIGATSGFLIASAFCRYIYLKKSGFYNRQDTDAERTRRVDYGTFGPNLSRPSSPNHLTLASQPPQTQQTQPIVQETGLIDDAKQAQQAAGPVPQDPKERGSDTSSMDSNILSDDELTALSITGEMDTPQCPHSDRGTCDMSLICRQCRKVYCNTHQSQFYRRHMITCQGTATGGSTDATSQACTNQFEADCGSGSDSSNSTPSIEGSGEQH